MQLAPHYLGRTVEEWLADFCSAEYVEGMELPCRSLPMCLMDGPITSFFESQSPCDTNLMCGALSCFGLEFIQEAVQTLGKLEDRKQARLIFCIADAGRTSIPYLVQLLEYPSANARAAACVALAESFDSEPDWPPDAVKQIAAILHRVPQSYGECLEVFAQFCAVFPSRKTASRDDMDVLAAIALRVEDDDVAVRIAAIETLTFFEHCKRLFPDLADVLLYVLRRDPNADVRKLALRNLAHRDAMDYARRLTQPDIDNLLRYLDDADPAVRRDAAAIIGYLHAYGTLNVASLLQCDGDPDRQFGSLATCELFAMVPGFTAQLMARLEDRRAAVRACAAGALARANKRFGWIKGRRDEAVPALAEMLHDKASDVRGAALQALVLLRKASLPDVDEILDKATRHWDWAVRSNARSALHCSAGKLIQIDYGECGEPRSSGRAPAIPASVRQVQAKCRQLADAPLDVVITALRDPDIAVRLAAIDALEKTDPSEHNLGGHLLGLLNDTCSQVRWRTKLAIDEIIMKRTRQAAG